MQHEETVKIQGIDTHASSPWSSTDPAQIHIHVHTEGAYHKTAAGQSTNSSDLELLMYILMEMAELLQLAHGIAQEVRERLR